MDRVFVDANVLWSASFRSTGRTAQIWGIPNIRLLTSAYAIVEATRNIEDDRHLRDLQRLLHFVEVVPPPTSSMPAGVRLSVKDQPILLAAIDGKATHLITGDRDFEALLLKRIEGVLILTPRQFLDAQEH